MELQVIQNKIYEVRGIRVMLDFDLARLYEVPTKALNQAVKRNADRFPKDFMFQLTEQELNNLTSQFEASSLRSQSVTSNRGGRRYMPYAFTEQGVSMLSAVLRSPVAVQTSITIMRAFVAMRNYIMTTATVTAELAELRTSIELLRRDGEDTLEAVNDLSEDTRKHIDNLYEAIGELSVKPTTAPRKPIGYKTGSKQ